jgi:hypothetical protein
VLHSFLGAPGNAQYPTYTLAIESSGNLYGISNRGGTDYLGVLYEICSAYVATHSFAGGIDGEDPESTPVIDSAGNLYGTSYRSENGDAPGAIWKYSPGSGLSVLSDFGSGRAYGGSPSGKLRIFELLPGAALPR